MRPDLGCVPFFSIPVFNREWLHSINDMRMHLVLYDLQIIRTLSLLRMSVNNALSPIFHFVMEHSAFLVPHFDPSNSGRPAPEHRLPLTRILPSILLFYQPSSIDTQIEANRITKMQRDDGTGNGHGGQEDEGAAERGGHLLHRPPLPEFPSSQSISIELIAPPNTQELSSQSVDLCDGDTTMAAVEHDAADDMKEMEGEEEDTEMNENVFHVREILADMLSGENNAHSSGNSEKDRDEREKLQLYQLRCCVLDDANLEELEKLPKRMCAYEFKPGDIAWNCRVCQVTLNVCWRKKKKVEKMWGLTFAKRVG